MTGFKYRCVRCNYGTSTKSHMKSHINRKNLCKLVLKDVNPKDHQDEIFEKIIDDNKICKYCEKEFTRSYTCKIHMEKCKNIETTKETAGTEALMELVKTLNNQITNQSQEMKDLKELVKKAGVTNYNTTNNTMNIVILPYNETDVSHLKDRDYYNSISRCIMSVPKLIEKTHFDPNKPENHNIYISNISKGHAMVWDGKKWLVKDQTEVVEDLIAENEYRLEDWVQEGQKKFPKAMEKFKLYVSKRDEKGVPELVRKEVKMMLYNNRDMIEEIVE